MMKKRQIIFSLLIINLLAFGCSFNERHSNSENLVIFYQPDSKQTNEFIKNDTLNEFIEYVSDYNYYKSSFIELYKDSAIKIEVCTTKIISNKNLKINIDTLDSEFGFVLVKDNEYNIRTGVHTGVDINLLVQDFFNK